MSGGGPSRPLVEGIRAQNLNRDQLFNLISALANCLDREIVTEIAQSILGVEPVERDDCVVFDDIAVSFFENGRVKGMYQIIDGTPPPGQSGA